MYTVFLHWIFQITVLISDLLNWNKTRLIILWFWLCKILKFWCRFNTQKLIKYWAFSKGNICLINKNLSWWFLNLIINQSKISKFIQNFDVIFKMSVNLKIFISKTTYFYTIIRLFLLFNLGFLNILYFTWMNKSDRLTVFRIFFNIWKLFFTHSKTGFWYLIIWLNTILIICSTKWIYRLFSYGLFNKLF